MFVECCNNIAMNETFKEDPNKNSNLSASTLKFITKKYGSIDAFYRGKGADTNNETIDGFARIKNLRRALSALDAGGWERSYHQRVFHENFLNAVVKCLFKTDPPGTFERAYPRLLESQNWTSINQEILISTPRRFGKTISVCLFCAALLFACPRLEISIYSTCKRISSKLLRNCTKFLSIIHDVLKLPEFPYIKQTTDEVEIQGPEGKYDTRKLNSYPSKESIVACDCSCPVLCFRATTVPL